MAKITIYQGDIKTVAEAMEEQLQNEMEQFYILFGAMFNSGITDRPDFIRRVIIEVAESHLAEDNCADVYCVHCNGYRGHEKDCIVPRCIELAKLMKKSQ